MVGSYGDVYFDGLGHLSVALRAILEEAEQISWKRIAQEDSECFSGGGKYPAGGETKHAHRSSGGAGPKKKH